ncbi:MAG: ERF family protein [Limnospira maxima]
MSSSIYVKLFNLCQEIREIPKSGYNKFLKFQYATINDIEAILKPLLEKYKLLVIHTVSTTAEMVTSTPVGLKASGNQILTTKLIDIEDINAEPIVSSISVGSFDCPPQETGGRITYARRYNLSCIFSLCSEEDPDQSYGAPNKRTSSQKQKAIAQQSSPQKQSTFTPKVNTQSTPPTSTRPDSKSPDTSLLMKKSDALLKQLQWDIATAKHFLSTVCNRDVESRSFLTPVEWETFMSALTKEVDSLHSKAST